MQICQTDPKPPEPKTPEPKPQRRLTGSQADLRQLVEVFERHGAKPPEASKLGAFAKLLRAYRDRLGEGEGLAGLARDLDALGSKLREGSRYALACLRGKLEQDRAGEGGDARAAAENPFQPVDPRRPR